ncbi:MAG: MBL fold metallo-hydrolase [Planctomycetes bacterium]|nr:MBL fold metallo-hydrolase [Planctomycetota bacterium]
MIIEACAVGPFVMNAYLVGSEASGDAVLIDAGDEIDRLLALAKKKKLSIKAILSTHGHIDHVAGAAECRRKTGARHWLHRLDVPWLENLGQQAAMFGLAAPEPGVVDEHPEEGKLLSVSDLSFKVLHVPGHTQGHVAYVLGDQAWVGDCLFAGSIGRTDLPGGDTEQLLTSIRTKLLPLGDEVVAWPGHGPRTTMGRERRTNPFVGEE